MRSVIIICTAHTLSYIEINNKIIYDTFLQIITIQVLSLT